MRNVDNIQTSDSKHFIDTAITISFLRIDDNNILIYNRYISYVYIMYTLNIYIYMYTYTYNIYVVVDIV